MVKHVNGKELNGLINTSDLPVFCDFWASWCGPCRMLAPVFDELSEKYEGKAIFVKVNIDEEEEAAIRYGITSIPNVLVFKGGNVAGGHLGFAPEPVLDEFIQNNL